MVQTYSLVYRLAPRRSRCGSRPLVRLPIGRGDFQTISIGGVLTRTGIEAFYRGLTSGPNRPPAGAPPPSLYEGMLKAAGLPQPD